MGICFKITYRRKVAILTITSLYENVTFLKRIFLTCDWDSIIAHHPEIGVISFGTRSEVTSKVALL